MEFTVGNVVGRGLRIWARNLPVLIVLSLVVYSPVIAVGALTPGEVDASFEEEWQEDESAAYVREGLPMGELVANLLTYFLSFAMTGAVTYGVIRRLNQEPAGFFESVRVGLGRFFPALGTGIVVSLVVGIGTLLLIVPGIYLSAMLAVAVPAAVVERIGVGGALARSRSLTLGHKWRVLGVSVVVMLLSVLLSFALGVVGGLATSGDGGSAVMWIAILAAILTTGTLQPVCFAVAYHDLRVVKEGVSVEDLAKVFE